MGIWMDSPPGPLSFVICFDRALILCFLKKKTCEQLFFLKKNTKEKGSRTIETTHKFGKKKPTHGKHWQMYRI